MGQRPTSTFTGSLGIPSSFSKLLVPILVVLAPLAALFIGRQIPSMGPSAGKSVLMLPAVTLIAVAWRLTPPPRAFRVFCALLLLIPLQFEVPFGALNLIPGFGALGTAWEQAMYALALVLTLNLLSRREAWRIPTGATIGMALFLVSGLAVLLREPDPSGGNLIWWGRVSLFPASALVISSIVVHGTKEAERLLGIIVAGPLIVAALLAVLLPLQLFGATEGSGTANWLLTMGRLGGVLRASPNLPFLGTTAVSLGGNAPTLGEALAMSFPVIIAHLMLSPSRRGRRIAMVGGVLLVALLAATNARGAFAAAAAAAIVVYLAAALGRRASGRRVNTSTAAGLAALGTALMVAWPMIAPSSSELTVRLAEMSDPGSARSLVTRWELWDSIAPVFGRDPFGIGYYGSSPIAMLNPHNVFIFILQGSGVIGFLGFTIAVAAALPPIIRGLRTDDPRRQLVAAAVLGMLASALVSGVGSALFQNHQLGANFWAALGVVFALDWQLRQRPYGDAGRPSHSSRDSLEG